MKIHGFAPYPDYESWLQKGSFRALRNKSWICIVSGIMNPDFKRFVSNHKSWIQSIFKDSPVFTNPTNPYESNKSLQILSTIAQNKSLKIEICKSKSLQIHKFRIHKSGFANPNLKDLYRGFDSLVCFWKICFVDLFCENKNIKLLDLFWFGRICIQIPHP